MCQYKVDYMKSFNFWLLIVKISLTSLIVVVTALVSVITICGIKNHKIAIILMVILEKKEINWLTFLS